MSFVRPDPVCVTLCVWEGVTLWGCVCVGPVWGARVGGHGVCGVSNRGYHALAEPIGDINLLVTLIPVPINVMDNSLLQSAMDMNPAAWYS